MKILPSTYIPNPNENRMKNEGGLVLAREYILSNKNPNLHNLLRIRYDWMKKFLTAEKQGIEFGAGIGATRIFLPHLKIISTDLVENEWLDKCPVDATASGFVNEQLDYVLVNQVLHHIVHPARFFNEAYRILKPNGLLVIQDPWSSFFFKLALRLMRHEGYDDLINLSEENPRFCISEDPWAANCSAARLIFGSDDGKKLFEKFNPIHVEKAEFFSFINSGGVTAKTGYLALPAGLLRFQEFLDRILTKIAPNIFALQIRVVLQKL
jgi:SAM-dependent methyltransferase